MWHVRISTVDVQMRTKRVYKTKHFNGITYRILALYVLWYNTW